MSKRKLQPFFHKDCTVYVFEAMVKKVMKMATDGEFTSVETRVYSPTESTTPNGLVTFTYKTELSTGHISLDGQKVDWR